MILALTVGLVTVWAGEPNLHASGHIASLGDLLSQSRNYGGVGLGTIYTSIAFLTVIAALVTWVTFEGNRASKANPAR
jgi:uncharacterized membrane-anchored protein